MLGGVKGRAEAPVDSSSTPLGRIPGGLASAPEMAQSALSHVSPLTCLFWSASVAAL